MMTELKLEVGKTYKARDGSKVRIDLYNRVGNYPFESKGYATYTYSGRVWGDHEDHKGDLISEYTPPAAAPQPAIRTPRPHAQLRKDFADGWDIEFFSLTYGKWVLCTAEPGWHPDVQFRIKPEPAPLKPNEVAFVGIVDGTLGLCLRTSAEDMADNATKAIRIEWNPNDQTLVSAEVVTL